MNQETFDFNRQRDELHVVRDLHFHVIHRTLGMLCAWNERQSDRGTVRIYRPIKFEHRAAALNWIESGSFEELQRSEQTERIEFSLNIVAFQFLNM